jgi:hypothetical protein
MGILVMGKKRSYAGKKQYAAYNAESRYSKNKDKKAKRHAKKHPNDNVTYSTEYTRKKSRATLSAEDKFTNFSNHLSKVVQRVNTSGTVLYA